MDYVIVFILGAVAGYYGKKLYEKYVASVTVPPAA